MEWRIYVKILITISYKSGKKRIFELYEKHACLLTYLLTYLLHGAESFLSS